MKTVYIPKGETVTYDTLTTEHLVVDGRLNVTDGIKARTITGNGVVDADTVAADSIHLSDLEATSVICERLIAKRVETTELYAAESATVTCFLSASYVNTGRLAVALNEIGEVKAAEVINLPARKRSLLRFLLESALRSFLVRLFAPTDCDDAEDAEYRSLWEVEEDRDDRDDAA